MTLTTLDNGGHQYQITDAYNEKSSSHYSEGGSGFGTYTFSVTRSSKASFADIRVGYRIQKMKGIGLCLFDGEIRAIGQSSSSGSITLDVTCLGMIVYIEEEELVRAICDGRLGEWKTNGEIPSGLYRPDAFSVSTNAVGLNISASTKDVDPNAYTEVVYTFNDWEIAERVTFSLVANLGTGVIFNAEVDSIDSVSNYVYYTSDVGEGNITQGMTLYNSTASENGSVSAIDTGLNRITLSGGTVSSWSPGDQLVIYGPLFQSNVLAIADAVISYSDDESVILGESNISGGERLVNLTQKIIATVSSIDTGANEITVTDENDITGWTVNDLIVVTAPLFEAQIVSVLSDEITYSSPLGEPVVSSTASWVLYNADLGDFAEVLSWNTGSSIVTVTSAGDISTWGATETIQIFAPYALSILQDDGTTIWPVTDWREGAVPSETAVDVLTTVDMQRIFARVACFIGGSGSEHSFFQLGALRAYSIEPDASLTTLGREVVDQVGGVKDLISSFKGHLEDSGRVVEPMVHEFVSAREAMSSVAQAGGSSYARLAWGIVPDIQRALFTEPFGNLAHEDLVFRPSEKSTVSVSIDAEKHYQRVRGKYTDKSGAVQFTAWLYDDGYYFNGRYRDITLQVDGADTEAEALLVAQKYLDENKQLKYVASDYTIADGDLFTESGRVVPFDEVIARGQQIRVIGWYPAGVNTDIEASIQDYVASAEIDYQAKTVKISPAAKSNTFEKIMAELSRLARG